MYISVTYVESSILHFYLVPLSHFLQYFLLRRFYLSVLSQFNPFLLPSTVNKGSSGDYNLQYTVTAATKGTSSVVYCVISSKHTFTYKLSALCRSSVQNLKLCVPCIILQCVKWPARCTILIINFIPQFFALRVSKESNRSKHVEQTKKTVE
jgi:hypothetical protein